MARAGHATLGMSQAGTDILLKDIKTDSTPVAALMPIMSRMMALGPLRNCIVKKAAEVMSTSLYTLALGNESFITIKLYEWTRHEMLMATTEAVFGPKNPYRDPAVEQAWR